MLSLSSSFCLLLENYSVFIWSDDATPNVNYNQNYNEFNL